MRHPVQRTGTTRRLCGFVPVVKPRVPLLVLPWTSSKISGASSDVRDVTRPAEAQNVASQYERGEGSRMHSRPRVGRRSLEESDDKNAKQQGFRTRTDPGACTSATARLGCPVGDSACVGLVQSDRLRGARVEADCGRPAWTPESDLANTPHSARCPTCGHCYRPAICGNEEKELIGTPVQIPG
jgi:hypothetical protein